MASQQRPSYKFLDVFEFESSEPFQKVHFYDNCTFLRDFGKYKKGDQVKCIYVDREGTIWIDGTGEYFIPNSWIEGTIRC